MEEFPPTGRGHRFCAAGHLEFHESRHEPVLSCGFIPLPSIGSSQCAQHSHYIASCLFTTCFLNDKVVFIWFNNIQPAFNLQKTCLGSHGDGVGYIVNSFYFRLCIMGFRSLWRRTDIVSCLFVYFGNVQTCQRIALEYTDKLVESLPHNSI